MPAEYLRSIPPYTKSPTTPKRMDLYIATRSDNPNVLKIGKSSNTLARCAQLQRGHCFKIYVNAILENKGDCEKAVHDALKQYRIAKTEWFETDLETALTAAAEAEPTPKLHYSYDLETIALRNLRSGRTLRSTRYPHLMEGDFA